MKEDDVTESTIDRGQRTRGGSLGEFLDREDITRLVLGLHAYLDRWEWDAVPGHLTEDCDLTTLIDGVPVFVNVEAGESTGLAEGTNWRERSGIKGQHQWTNVVVDVDGDTARVWMSGTQTNSWPDGQFEVSGVLGEGICRRTPEGWRIASFVGDYRSNHERLSTYFAPDPRLQNPSDA